MFCMSWQAEKTFLQLNTVNCFPSPVPILLFFLQRLLALNPAVSVSVLQRIAGKLLSLPEDDLNSSFAHCYTVRCLCVNPSVPARVFKKLVDKFKLHPDTQKMLRRLRRYREKVALKASASAVCAYGGLPGFFC